MSARRPDPSPRRAAIQRRNLAFLCSIGIAVGLVGTIVTAEGDLASLGGQRTYDLSGFEGISSFGSADIEVSVGPAFSVRGAGSPGALDRYELAVADGVLKIQPKDDSSWGSLWSGWRGATFQVTLPRLSSAALAGSGDMKIDRVAGPKFAADLQGSGDVDIAALAVDEADLSLGGSGDLSAGGKVNRARVVIAGSGDADASRLASASADVSVRGSGDAALTVADTADVSIQGSGDVAIGGSARCKVSRMGSGEVRCPA